MFHFVATIQVSQCTWPPSLIISISAKSETSKEISKASQPERHEIMAIVYLHTYLYIHTYIPKQTHTHITACTQTERKNVTCNTKYPQPLFLYMKTNGGVSFELLPVSSDPNTQVVWDMSRCTSVSGERAAAIFKTDKFYTKNLNIRLCQTFVPTKIHGVTHRHCREKQISHVDLLFGNHGEPVNSYLFAQ